MTSRSARGYIGPSLVVHGRISGKGDLTVDGRLEGDVAFDGALAVGRDGVLLAAVATDSLDVSGQVRGNVAAAEEVSIRSGGDLHGDVRAPHVAIDDGGRLHGGIDMDVDLPETPELEEL
ncbi:MAG: polymer-forming cytoskeletal protein [Myxococcota bacterium]